MQTKFIENGQEYITEYDLEGTPFLEEYPLSKPITIIQEGKEFTTNRLVEYFGISYYDFSKSQEDSPQCESEGCNANFVNISTFKKYGAVVCDNCTARFSHEAVI